MVIVLNKKIQRSFIFLVLFLFLLTTVSAMIAVPAFSDNPVVVITVKTDMFYPISNATVYIDEAPIGTSNTEGVLALYQFPSGVHNITAVKYGFINKTITQDLTGGTSIDYILHDQPPVGPSVSDSMSIIVLDDTVARGTIAEAQIYIDGQHVGQTDRANGRYLTNLTGVHQVLVSKKDLVNNTATVDFSKGGIYTFLMSSGGKKFSIFDIDLFWRSFGQELSVGLINTLKLSLIAFAIGICIGLIMGLGRVSSNPIFKTLSSIYVEGVRGLPLLLQLLFAYYAIPFMWTDLTGGVLPIDGFTACLLALSVNSGSYMGEIFKAGIEAIHKGQMEASRSLGMSYNQSMRYVILPQAVKIVLPALGNEFIALIKDSSIALIISYQDILWNAKYIGAASYNTFTPILAAGIIYLCITIPLGRAVQYMERRLNMNVSKPREQGTGGFGGLGRKKKPIEIAPLQNNPEFVEVEHER